MFLLVCETKYFPSTMPVYIFLLIMFGFNNLDICHCMILILGTKINYIFHQ